MRVRIARSVLESRAPLGLWLLSVLAFFALCLLSGAGLAFWSAGGFPAALGLHGASEAVLGLLAVYICWAPEDAVWSAAGSAPPGAFRGSGRRAGPAAKVHGRSQGCPRPGRLPVLRQQAQAGPAGLPVLRRRLGRPVVRRLRELRGPLARPAAPRRSPRRPVPEVPRPLSGPVLPLVRKDIPRTGVAHRMSTHCSTLFRV